MSSRREIGPNSWDSHHSCRRGRGRCSIYSRDRQVCRQAYRWEDILRAEIMCQDRPCIVGNFSFDFQVNPLYWRHFWNETMQFDFECAPVPGFSDGTFSFMLPSCNRRRKSRLHQRRAFITVLRVLGPLSATVDCCCCCCFIILLPDRRSETLNDADACRRGEPLCIKLT